MSIDQQQTGNDAAGVEKASYDIVSGGVHWTSNDAELYESRTSETEVQNSANALGSEVTYLIDRVDTDLVLKKHLIVEVHYTADGVQVHAPKLEIWEFGNTYAEAMDNLISYMAQDFRFLSVTEDSKLTQDARNRRDTYFVYVGTPVASDA